MNPCKKPVRLRGWTSNAGVLPIILLKVFAGFLPLYKHFLQIKQAILTYSIDYQSIFIKAGATNQLFEFSKSYGRAKDCIWLLILDAIT